MDQLPPIGMIAAEKEGEVLAFLDELDEKSDHARSSWAELADQNVMVYEYGAVDTATLVYANDIQDAVIAITDVQCREPPVIELDAPDTDDEPVTFWIGPPTVAMQMGIDPAYYMGAVDRMTGQQFPPAPIPEELAEPIAQTLMAIGMDPEKHILRASNETAAELIQTIFDRVWEKSCLNEWYRANTLDTNIAGWQVALYEQSDLIVEMTEMSVRQAFLDPTQRTIKRMAWCGIELLLDKTWALKRYPHLTPHIEAEASSGMPMESTSAIATLGELAGVDYAQRMVRVRYHWLRNQPMPLSEDEALQSGMVQKTMVPDEAAIQELSNEEYFGRSQLGDGSTGQALVDRQTGGGTQENPEAEGLGSEQPPLPEQAGAQPQIPMRPVFLDADGAEITVASPKWPARTTLRRICYVNDKFAEDVEAKYIPLVHNICIPVPRKPWGIGEPYRQLNKQKARNTLITGMVDHCKYNSHPERVMSESMFTATVMARKKMGEAGGIIVIPDDQWNRVAGKLNIVQELPPMNSDLNETQQLLKTEINDSAGHVDVMRGSTPPGVDSGKAIQLLQSAAASTSSLKSQYASDMLYNLALLINADLLEDLTPQIVMGITQKYPEHVAAWLVEKCKSIDWKITVSTAGGGALKAQKRAEAVEDLQLTAITMETYRDIAGRDHKLEEQRTDTAAEAMMQRQTKMAVAGGGQPDEEGKPSNGNGAPSRNGNGRQGAYA